MLDRCPQLLAANAVALQIVGAGDGPLLEVAAGVLETLDLGHQPAGALDQGRVRGLGLRGPPGLALRRFARFEQPALRRRQLLVRGPLLELDAMDGFPRLVLTRLLGAQLFFRRPALDATCSCLRETRSPESPALTTCSSNATIAFS